MLVSPATRKGRNLYTALLRPRRPRHHHTLPLTLIRLFAMLRRILISKILVDSCLRKPPTPVRVDRKRLIWRSQKIPFPSLDTLSRHPSRRRHIWSNRRRIDQISQRQQLMRFQKRLHRIRPRIHMVIQMMSHLPPFWRSQHKLLRAATLHVGHLKLPRHCRRKPVGHFRNRSITSAPPHACARLCQMPRKRSPCRPDCSCSPCRPRLGRLQS